MRPVGARSPIDSGLGGVVALDDVALNFALSGLLSGAWDFDAFALALGARGDSTLVRQGTEQGQVTAVFDIAADHPAQAGGSVRVPFATSPRVDTYSAGGCMEPRPF